MSEQESICISVKISGQVQDYQIYLWAKFHIEIAIFRSFTRSNIPDKEHCVTLEEEQKNSF
jgi:hypothetical protein